MDKWRGKTAIVTGASAGIGKAIVRDFANAGINVIALARRLERLVDLQNELKTAPGKVTALKCDVSDKASIEAAFDEIERKFGSAQILVNNAGVAHQAGIFDDNDDTIDGIIASTVHTNFLGLVRVTRRAYQLMEKAGDYGAIINIGSINGHTVPFNNFKMNVYSATKFGVRGLTESIRQEIITRDNLKVRVCVISPGCVETEIFEAGGWQKDAVPTSREMPVLKDVDVSQAVQFILMTPYSVNITDIIVKPVGERF